MKKNNPKVLNAWAFYDWANSVYNLVITTTVFPIFYNSATREAFGSDEVKFFGFDIENTVLYSYALAVAYFITAIITPALSGIADYGGSKKPLMKFFTYMGAGACLFLYFFDGSNVELGILCAVFASIGFAGGMVFYNAFLPEIATPDRYDRVSAKGFALGYVGSVLLQLVNLGMVMQPELFGLKNSAQGAQVSFLTVGIWWIVFAQIPFYYLKDREVAKQKRQDLIRKGFKEVKRVWFVILHTKALKKFLWSFFFFNMGVQTVMLMASLFGEKELKLETSSLIIIILIIQIVAIGGAYLFAIISEKHGNKFSLILMLFIWIGICMGAYFVTTEKEFYVVAVLVGVVMGGIQSLSRSSFSKLLPRDTQDTASYFSFFNIADRLSTMFGLLSYGIIEQVTGSMRNSLFALVMFFVIGLAFLWTIPKFTNAPAHIEDEVL
ncbi:MAG: MFS transporter [Bernardetiaceae bacterium]|nr:MFS transporter [Bernardetiaceae bacterium]